MLNSPPGRGGRGTVVSTDWCIILLSLYVRKPNLSLSCFALSTAFTGDCPRVEVVKYKMKGQEMVFQNLRELLRSLYVHICVAI